MSDSNWHQLDAGIVLPVDDSITVPPLTEVELPGTELPGLDEIEARTRAAVIERLAASVEPGMTVAVGGGSRGIARRVELLRGTISGLRSLGAEPFVVPAMGSHGGGTAEGQVEVLASLGITPDSVDCEIRSTMETIEITRTEAGVPVYLDAHAAAADRILPVNRTKPHTCFKGPIESGCSKMVVVGFGKRLGAAEIHASGPVGMRDRVVQGVAAIRATGRLLGGVASVEASDGSIVALRVFESGEVGTAAELELTELAKELVPALPFDEIDVLIVERGGKDISGTSIDPNVTGRFFVHGMADWDTPSVATIVLLSLTEVSEGNATGIGLADFIPADVARHIDWPTTYLNCFTAGFSGSRRGRMPMVLRDEEACIRAALAMCGRPFSEPRRVVRIESTLHLTRCWVSAPLLQELPPGARVV